MLSAVVLAIALNGCGNPITGQQLFQQQAIPVGRLYLGTTTPNQVAVMEGIENTGLQIAPVANTASFPTTSAPSVSVDQTETNGNIQGDALIVADPAAGTVSIFNSAFLFLGPVAPVPDIQITGFTKPVATFSDPISGLLFVVDQGANSVLVFKGSSLVASQSAATAFATITGFNNPSSVTVDEGDGIGSAIPVDNLIVADTGNHQIFELTNPNIVLTGGTTSVSALKAQGPNVALTFTNLIPALGVLTASAVNTPIVVFSDSAPVPSATHFLTSELFIVDAGTNQILMCGDNGGNGLTPVVAPGVTSLTEDTSQGLSFLGSAGAISEVQTQLLILESLATPTTILQPQAGTGLVTSLAVDSQH
ncbi:MAG: NHL repeat-containing protein [Candidatus Xenobia bacterium]